ncbi:GntR family transcriptional regulator [Alicyclobacillus fastidiosus]|uniref:GntR family transcriptional regulator n=1 Tax=Alicyclobacillus fastidiosus TaxID=392011 RepID=A0ABV5AL80_9BACL|nr:GntR family transcriptional regulator [Alicyclobacillus fastidiosus]WEH10192.1 GntR family transcriptional regulator [Alicyclobacillus fastidiosus]
MHRYLEIHKDIFRRIQSGDWPPGTQLPSETVLASEYKTTRVTIRRALQLLEQEHVLTSRQGVGRFVAQPPATATSELTRLLDWRQFMRTPNKDLRTVTIASHEVALNSERAELLKRPEESPGYQFVQSRISTGTTVSMAVSVFPGAALAAQCSDAALLDTLKRHEEMAMYAESDILVPSVDDPYANYLQDCDSDPTSPILVLRQLFLDWRHAPLFLSYDYLNLRVFSLHLTRERDKSVPRPPRDSRHAHPHAQP